MKQSVKWLLGALMLVVLIAGASVLYRSLSENYLPDDTRLEPPQTEDSAPGDSTPVNPPLPQSPESDDRSPGKEEAAAPDAGSTEPTPDPPAPTTPPVTPSVPDFTVLDAQGNERRLSEFFGKPIVLNFWASWCYYCVKEMPDFEDAYYEHDDVVFMMINVTDGNRETRQKAAAFIEQKGFTFPVYYDVAMEASLVYGVRALPKSVFINANGELVTVALGMLSADELEQRIAMITQ